MYISFTLYVQRTFQRHDYAKRFTQGVQGKIQKIVHLPRNKTEDYLLWPKNNNNERLI